MSVAEERMTSQRKDLTYSTGSGGMNHCRLDFDVYLVLSILYSIKKLYIVMYRYEW